MGLTPFGSLKILFWEYFNTSPLFLFYPFKNILTLVCFFAQIQDKPHHSQTTSTPVTFFITRFKSLVEVYIITKYWMANRSQSLYLRHGVFFFLQFKNGEVHDLRVLCSSFYWNTWRKQLQSKLGSSPSEHLTQFWFVHHWNKICTCHWTYLSPTTITDSWIWIAYLFGDILRIEKLALQQ